MSIDLKDQISRLKTEQCTSCIGGVKSFTNKPVKLPRFNGKFEEWQNFLNVFLATIHNSNILNVEKFSYPLGQVSDEPLTLLNSFALTDKNYDEAIKILA